MIEPVIISIIIAAGGLILTAIFNTKNYNRSQNNDSIAHHERSAKTEVKLDAIADSIKDLKKDTANDFSDLKKSVSKDIAELRSDVTQISHASSKVQIRHEKLEGQVENHERRIHSLERWRDREKRR